MQSSNLVSIVLATYNEKENILRTIEEIFRHVASPVEVIVVDDNSPDRTWELVENLRNPSVKLIRRLNERGLASAFYRGIQESRGEKVGWMDADMSMPPSLLPKMISNLDQYDLVIASRYAKGGRDERDWLRVTTSRLINRLAQILLMPQIGDCDSGFIVVKREVLNRVPIIPAGYGEYFIEFLYAATRKGFKINEVPYVFKDREFGSSKSAPNLAHFFKTGLDYIGRIMAARFRN